MPERHPGNGSGQDQDDWLQHPGSEEQAIIRTAAAQTFALMMQNSAALQQSLFTILNAMASKALSNMAENSPADAVDKIGTLLGSSASIDQVAKIIELATKGSLPQGSGEGQGPDETQPGGQAQEKPGSPTTPKGRSR